MKTRLHHGGDISAKTKERGLSKRYESGEPCQDLKRQCAHDGDCGKGSYCDPFLACEKWPRANDCNQKRPTENLARAQVHHTRAPLRLPKIPCGRMSKITIITR